MSQSVQKQQPQCSTSVKKKKHDENEEENIACEKIVEEPLCHYQAQAGIL